MSDITVLGPGNEVLYRRELRPGENAHVHVYVSVDEPLPTAATWAAGMLVIDTSEHQGVVGWDVVQNVARVEGVTARTSQGRVQDKRFAENWPEICKRWATRAVYHYWQNEVGVQEQIDTFLRALEAGKADTAPEYACDVEDQSPPFTERELEDVRRWLEAMERALGKRGWIYTGNSVWQWPVAWAAEHRMWLGQYTRGAYQTPGPWAQPFMWQCSSRGRLPGFAGNVDLNVVGDGKQAIVRPWWWTGTTTEGEVPPKSGLHPNNFFVTAKMPLMKFHSAPHGPVVREMLNVAWKMTVQAITADGWLKVHQDGATEWWCEAETTTMGTAGVFA